MASGRRTPTRADHEKFCINEDWSLVRNTRGNQGHHMTYELVLSDGATLRTRISHPVNRTDYGPSLWSHVLKDQLQVTESEFWDCVSDKKLPQRSTPMPVRPGIPAGVVYQLITKFHLPENEVMKLTPKQAIAKLNDFWSNSN